MSIFEQLAAPFPKEKISWRSQSVAQRGNNAGKKAMALAYIDARDVMNRLDEVCGPEGWQCEHYDAGGGKLACKIGIVGEFGQWIWKSDGSGETQVEGEKGAFSGALKRAAVAWGIGRYLYDMEAPWVGCETYEKQGKFYFKRWTEDPWSYVNNPDLSVHDGINPPTVQTQKSWTEADWKEWFRNWKTMVDACKDPAEVNTLVAGNTKLEECKTVSQKMYEAAMDYAIGREQVLATPDRELTPLDAG